MKKLVQKSIALILTLVLLTNTALIETRAKAEEQQTDVEEFRAVWVPYYDFDDSKELNKAEFSAYIDEMFDNIVS